MTQILLAAREPSTRVLYSCKWNTFKRFASQHNLPIIPTNLDTLLTFLRHLFQQGLSQSTLKVYIAAIVSHQPQHSEVSSLFRNVMLKAFLNGLHNLRPRVLPPLPQWSLQTVLHRLMQPPFEPMATTSEWLLTLKTAFLTDITSCRRVSELAALRVDPPYLKFHPDKVTLTVDVSFLPKVVSFPHHTTYCSPYLFPSPNSALERSLHSLDAHHELAFYVHCTKPFRKHDRIFVATHGPTRGAAVASQTISKWIVRTIRLAYELDHKPLPQGVRVHSMRAVPTSTALRGASIPDICRVATWSAPSTFASLYRMDVRAGTESSFGGSVLTSILP